MATSSGEDVDMMKAAEQVWGTLDKMAAASPEEYQRFIQQQLKEGEEVMAAPKPVFCLRATLQGCKGKYLYLNVCEWPHVPRPKTDEDPIPVKGGTVRYLLHKDSKRKTQHLVYDVAFHPYVMSECLKERELEEMLTGLCWDYVQNETNLRIADRKECKKLELTHKGMLSDIQASIDERWKEFLTPESRMDDIGDSILTQLRGLRAGQKEEEKDTTLPQLRLFPEKPATTANIRTRDSTPLAGSADSKPHPPSQPTSKEEQPKRLIQELSSEVKESYQTTEDGGRVCVPQHSVGVAESGRGRELSVKVVLPGVRGVKEVELEVSESDLELVVEGRYQLTLKFPESMQDELTRATFNTKQSLLTVTIPCSHSTNT